MSQPVRRKSKSMQTAIVDVWECPTGQKLMRVAFDHHRRLSRYRAPAAACNACSLKQLCTGSDRGREIEHSPDSWLQSELARFRRGISLSLLLLAELLLIAELIRHQSATEWLFLGFLLLPLTFFGTQLVSAFFASRAGPQPSMRLATIGGRQSLGAANPLLVV